MKKLNCKLLSIILCITLILTVLPLTVSGAEIQTKSVTTTVEEKFKTETETTENTIIGEISEKRESNIKHFRMSDGSIKAAVYSYDVHYTDEYGQLVDIDNSLSEENDGSDDVYSNKSNIFSVKFMKKSNPNKLYTINKGDYKIKVSVEGVSKVQGVAEALDNETLPQNQLALENIGSKMTYSNILENTDFEYTLVSTRLKENIILKEKVDFNNLIYTYHFTGGITAVAEDDKNIVIYEKDSENLIFNISAPTMWDSAGNYYDDLSLEIIESKNSKIKVRLNWSISNNAVYPVTVDPVLKFQYERNNIQDTHIISAYPTTNYDKNNHIRVRNNGYALLKFPTPTLKSGDKIINAYFALFPYGYFDNSLNIYTNQNSYNPALYITAHKILKNWNETTATYQNSNPDNGFYEDTVQSYRVVDGDSSFYTWDITRLANDWTEGRATNYGVLLKYYAPPADGSMFDSFFCSTNALETSIPAAYWPQMIYQYINTTGVENYFSYHTQEIGYAGTAYVNDLTGNLTLINSILQTGGALSPINISLVYNTNDVNKTEKPYGDGWWLNYAQKIEWVSINGATQTYAKYRDGDGTEHYFTCDTTGIWQDEIFKDRTIYYYENTGDYKLSDNSGTDLYFKRNGTLNEWYLYKVVDSYGNYIQMTLNSSNLNRVDKITASGGNTVDLLYDSYGLLSQINYYDSGTTKSISIEHNYTTNSLTKVTFCDGSFVKYDYYDNSSYLLKATDIDGYNRQYGYTWNNAKRVVIIAEVSSDSIIAPKIFVEYHPSATIFTDNSSGRKYLYTFAANGTLKSTVDVTNQDSNGYGKYYEYNNNNTTLSKGKNNLTFESKYQKTSINLLQNHSFESSNNLPGFQVWYASQSSQSGGLSTEKSHLGSYSYKMYCPPELPNSRLIAYYRVALQANTQYTFSAYVNTAGMVSHGKGVSLLVCTSGETVKSEYITESKNSWERISVTFIAPATETVSVCLSMVSATGTVYWDNVQFEVGELSEYNLIENAGFENWTNGSPTSWGVWGGPGYVETTNVSAGTRSLKFIGGITKSNEYQQWFGMPNGKKGDTFVMSAFAKATSVPAELNRFALIATMYYGNTIVTQKRFIFDSNITDWQKVSGVIKATGNYNGVTFAILYYNNCNTAYFDNVQVVKDNFGTSYTYDDNGNLTSTVDLQGKKDQTFTYNGNNKLIQQTTVAGGKIDYTYNTSNKHQLDSVKSGGVTSSFTYDSKGNALTSTVTGSDTASTQKITSSATYTSNGEYTDTMTDSRGHVTDYDYNEDRGLLKKVTSPDGSVTNYTYNASEMLTNVSVSSDAQNTKSSSVGYTYNANKLLQSITSPGGTVYNFTYDGFSRTDTIKVGNRLLSDYTYDNSKGLLSAMTYGNGTTVSYGYDILQRKNTTTINNVLRYKYLYDGSSRINEIIDALTGKRIKYEYDILDRFVSEKLIKNVNELENNSSVAYADLKIRYDNSKNRVAGYDVSIDGNTKATDYIYGELERAPDVINGVKQNGTRILSYGYDTMNRLTTRTVATTTPYVTEYTYTEGSGTNTTTTLIKTVKNGNDTLQYAYDNMGNITSITENGSLVESYTYDYLGQLKTVTVEKGETDDVYEYTYDNGGNITSVKLNGTETKAYTYGNAEWKDLLTAFNGEQLTYDTIGNPLTYRDGMAFTWSDGRKLTNVVKGTDNISYTYNADGLRDSKTINGVTTEYYWLNGVLQGQKTGSEYTFFLYDENGTAYGFLLKNGTTEEYYYYVFNAQGDVIEILDSAGTKVVEYTYDAWGDHLTLTGSMANTIGQKNPIRYRGYYYDTETGFYLTGTRYYDPEIGRFINADGQINDDILGTNLFAYCGNNPVTRADDTGRGWWVVAGALIGGIAGGVTKIVSNVTTGKKWNEGVIGATVGGAVYGGVLAATGNVWAAGFASAAAEALTNEVVSYIPKVSQANGQTVTKKVTTGNVIDSTKTVLNDTAVNGTISAVTGKIAGKIVPTNNGWFKPQKFVSSFAGKYAIKSELQTLTQSGLLFGVEGLKYSFNQRLKQGQQPIVTFFPDTEIRAAG